MTRVKFGGIKSDDEAIEPLASKLAAIEYGVLIPSFANNATVQVGSAALSLSLSLSRKALINLAVHPAVIQSTRSIKSSPRYTSVLCILTLTRQLLSLTVSTIGSLREKHETKEKSNYYGELVHTTLSIYVTLLWGDDERNQTSKTFWASIQYKLL